MIRVLHFIPAFGIGGMESLILSLYRNIDRNKVQFDFLVETKEDIKVFDEINLLGGNIYKIENANKYNPLAYFIKINSFFYTNAEKFEIVHCHNYERGPIINFFARIYGIKCRIFHAHTNSMEDVRFKQIKRLLMRLNNKLSTHFLASSDDAGKFYFSKDKKVFEVFKNSIDVKKFTFNKKTRDSLRRELNFGNSLVLGHTGRFTYAKNHFRIIEIFKKLNEKFPNSRLLLVGDGPLRNDIKSLVDNYSLSKVVYMVGERDNISDYLNTMDIFLLPSHFEGFCISLLEAQASGLPSLVSSIIPSEVELTNLVKKRNLSEDDNIWIDDILRLKSLDRRSENYSIIKYGYDTHENAKKLENFYFDCTII